MRKASKILLFCIVTKFFGWNFNCGSGVISMIEECRPSFFAYKRSLSCLLWRIELLLKYYVFRVCHLLISILLNILTKYIYISVCSKYLVVLSIFEILWQIINIFTKNGKWGSNQQNSDYLSLILPIEYTYYWLFFKSYKDSNRSH